MLQAASSSFDLPWLAACPLQPSPPQLRHAPRVSSQQVRQPLQLQQKPPLLPSAPSISRKNHPASTPTIAGAAASPWRNPAQDHLTKCLPTKRMIDDEIQHEELNRLHEETN